jgi:hypothetical protein
MAETFDPYLQWLGIRDPHRPPNHYRLLGVDLFESDADVLTNAADRQMAHVRTFQSGKRSAESQRLLNELAAAKICLLNAKKKADYDAGLRARQEAQSPRAAPPPPPASVAPPPVAGFASPPSPRGAPPPARAFPVEDALVTPDVVGEPAAAVTAEDVMPAVETVAEPAAEIYVPPEPPPPPTGVPEVVFRQYTPWSDSPSPRGPLPARPAPRRKRSRRTLFLALMLLAVTAAVLTGVVLFYKADIGSEGKGPDRTPPQKTTDPGPKPKPEPKIKAKIETAKPPVAPPKPVPDIKPKPLAGPDLAAAEKALAAARAAIDAHDWIGASHELVLARRAAPEDPGVLREILRLETILLAPTPIEKPQPDVPPPKPKPDPPEAKLPPEKPPQPEPRDPTAKEIRDAFPGPTAVDDATYAQVSKAETSPAVRTGLSLTIGDQWWEAGQAAKDGRLQRAAQGRAAKWYRLALPNLTGPDQARVERRLKELEQGP